MYRLELKAAAVRALRKLDSGTAERVRGAMALLGVEPRPPASRKLSGRDAYRIRVGDYRILYTIDDVGSLVIIVVVGHRSNVYR